MLPALAVTVALFAVACGDGFGSTVTAPNSGDRATGSASAAEPPPRESAAGTPAAPAAPATNAPAAPDASAPTKPASPAPDLSPAGVVTRAYQLALERAPHADGLAFWVDQLGAGTTKLALLRALVTSEE